MKPLKDRDHRFNLKTVQILSAFCLSLFSHGIHAETLNMAISSVVGFFPARLALELGYYKDEGIDVKVIDCINGKRCLKHLTDGEAVVATVADMPIVFAAHQNYPFAVIATLSSSAKDNVFIVREDSKIKTPSDLNEKRVGYIAGTSSHYFTDTFLNFYSLGRNQIRAVQLDPAKLIEAIDNREFDAVGLYEPLATIAINHLGEKARALPNPNLYNTTFNLVSAPKVPDATLVKILRAIRKAVVFIKDNPDKTKQLIATINKVPKAELITLDKYDFDVKLSQTLLNTLEAQSRWAILEQLIQQPREVDFLDHVRIEPLKTLDRRAVSLIK